MGRINVFIKAIAPEKNEIVSIYTSKDNISKDDDTKELKIDHPSKERMFHIAVAAMVTEKKVEMELDGTRIKEIIGHSSLWFLPTTKKCLPLDQIYKIQIIIGTAK